MIGDFWAWASSMVRLLLKGPRKAVGFDLASIGEVQFFRSVLKKFAECYPDHMIWMFHQEDTIEEVRRLYPNLPAGIHHVPYRWLRFGWFKYLDLYITTEQFVTGPAGVYTITLFHGQPAKGVTFCTKAVPPRSPLNLNDALFLYGPLQRQALEEYLAIRRIEWPPHLTAFEIGYTKSDGLVRGDYDRDRVAARLGLDRQKTTVLYAPAFNDGASLRECGLEVLETLCSLKQFNVIAKLPIDCLAPTWDWNATGGINWFETIGEIHRKHNNFRLIQDMEADEALACADVLVTCVSSIGFEFLAIGRPVIYIDTPKFFSGWARSFFPDIDTKQWTGRTTVNGGREFGLVVANPGELPEALDEVLSNPQRYPRQRERLPGYLLYNAGRATEAAVAKIGELLAQRVRSRRPVPEVQAVLDAETRPLLKRIVRKLRRSLKSGPQVFVAPVLNRFGLTVVRTGLGFIDAKSTVAAARKRGMSVCEYRESLEDDPGKKGRRDFIIGQLQRAGAITSLSTVCEVGAGTGMYLERVLELAQPSRYEVYETDPGWVKFLMSEYGSRAGAGVCCHPADGSTLRFTPDGSCDLVHAHGVFVYLPVLRTARYLKECVRVCRPGGYIAFDCFLDAHFSSMAEIEKWLSGTWEFPVPIPEQFLTEFAAANGLSLHHSFSVPCASGQTKYFVWRRNV